MECAGCWRVCPSHLESQVLGRLHLRRGRGVRRHLRGRGGLVHRMLVLCTRHRRVLLQGLSSLGRQRNWRERYFRRGRQ